MRWVWTSFPNVERLRSDAPADDETIELVHTPAFVDATRRAGNGEEGDLEPVRLRAGGQSDLRPDA